MAMRTSSLLALPTSGLQHTLNHIDCDACEEDRRALARTSELRHLKFKDAADIILQDELNTAIEPRTHEDHVGQARRLNKFFGELVVEKIHEGNILNYQKQRARTAGPELINHEISFFKNVMKRAGLWKKLAPHVHRLYVPESQAGIALTPEKRDHVLKIASGNPRWWVAYLGSLLQANIGRGVSEILNIQRKYVDMDNRIVMILEGTKNEHRKCCIPMTDAIAWAMDEVLKRYESLCERQDVTPDPEHYIFPFLQTAARGVSEKAQRLGRMKIVGGGSYDFTRPMKSWRSAWDSLRAKAGVPKLRMYDWRHTKATEMMEDKEVSEHTVEDVLGHVTKRQKMRYRHIRDDAKFKALQRHQVLPSPMQVKTRAGVIELPVLQQRRPPEAETVVAANQRRKK